MSINSSKPQSKSQASTELAYSEHWYRALIEKSSDAITLVDRDSTILYVSPSIECMLGYSPAVLLGRKTFDFMHEDDRTQSEQALQELIQEEGKSITVTFRVRHQDQNWRWMEGILTNRLADPEIQAIIGNYRDITERKQAQEQKQLEGSHYRLLMHEASDMILITEPEGQILEANERATEILGFSQEELLQLSTIDLLHQDDPRDNPVSHSIERIKEGKNVRLERKMRRKDGSYIVVEGVGNLLSNGQVLNILRDVSERKRVEQALRASEQRYRLVVEHSSDIITLIDLEGCWFYISPAVAKILGYKPEELLHTSSLTLVHPEDLHKAQEAVEVAKKGQISATTYRYKHKNGQWVVMETTGTAIIDEQEQPSMMVFTLHDITSLIELEQRRDEFLGTTSHELRSPLTTIKASLQLAQRQFKRLPGVPVEEVIERVKEMLAMAERQVMVENRLIGDLLDVSRIQQNKLELHLKTCNLLQIAREVVADIQAVEQKRTIHLSLPENDILPVVADSDRIGQVLSNYLTNAIKYSPADQPIEVSLEQNDAVVKVAVRDYGAGLNCAEQQQVWERFYQSPSRTINKGSSGLGLGLYICRTIVEQHHGQVGLDSAPGAGSTFWFTLPYAKE